MNNLILLILCFVAGMLLRRSRRMPDNAPATLNSFIIHVSLPALTLLYIHNLKLSGDVLLVGRSEKRRVGKECRRLCRSRWSPYH
jgi:predicted permease